MEELVLSPSDFVAVLNQTLEFAYPTVVIEGELANFRIAKNRWLYFDLKDDDSSVPYFGSVYQLPGPLEDGMLVRAVATPRMHQRFGFTLNLQSIVPVGQGALKKAADLLAKKLAAEGLFAPERKRPLPFAPEHIGLITAGGSAAYADFNKILNERWGGVQISFVDTYVQGDQAPGKIIQAIELLNKSSNLPEVIVLTRGGGSADDLAAFNDERVVRAVAASRVPTLVAIGHEVDESLAELAADARASTPSNAAQLVVPDRQAQLSNLDNVAANLRREIQDFVKDARRQLKLDGDFLRQSLIDNIAAAKNQLAATARVVSLLDPQAALKRGYAILSKGNKHISSAKQVKSGDQLGVRLRDGTIKATAN